MRWPRRLREEYRAIIDARTGVQDRRSAARLLLRDAPGSKRRGLPHGRGRVEVLKHALRLLAERIRYHTCYSINIGRSSTTWS